MIKITFFGTSGAEQYKERDNTYMGIEVEGESYFIDVGGSPVMKSKIVGFPWLKIKGILLTHLHPDHIYGLFSLLHHYKLYELKEEISIYLPEEEVERLKRILTELKLYGERYPKLKFYGLPDTVKLIIDKEYKIYSFPARHNCPALGYKIESKGKKVIYSGDTYRSETLLSMAMDGEVLIHEASFLDEKLNIARHLGHSTAGEAGRIARLAKVKQLYLVHSYRHEESDLEKYLQEAKSEFNGKVVIPGDLDILIIK